jgi:hypothetical protein
MKTTAFWNTAPGSLLEVDRRFRGPTASIITLMMEAICTYETSVYFNYTTQRYTPEQNKKIPSAYCHITSSAFRLNNAKMKLTQLTLTTNEKHCGQVLFLNHRSAAHFNRYENFY